MSLPLPNKTNQKSRKQTQDSIVLNEDKYEATGSQDYKSANAKRQNFFQDNEDSNSSEPKNSIQKLSNQQQTYLSRQLDTNPTPFTVHSRLITQTPKEDAVASANDIIALPADEENFEVPISLEKLKPFLNDHINEASFGNSRAFDNSPKYCREFQNDSNIFDDKLESTAQYGNFSPVSSVNKRTIDFLSPTSSALMPSKLTTEQAMNSPGTSQLKIWPVTDTSYKGEPQSARSDAQKKWQKLSNVFQSMRLMKREEVKTINNSAAIEQEIGAFKLPDIKEQQRGRWEISRQMFAKEAFQSIRRAQLFCECAMIGSPKHIDIMKELLRDDPKKFMLEPSDPLFILNQKNNAGHTPLYIAAKNGNIEVLKMLIENKANYLIESQISAQHKYFELPIQVAARWGHEPAVQCLLKDCKYERKILQQCIKNTPHKNIKALLKKALQQSSNKDSWKGLVKCFSSG